MWCGRLVQVSVSQRQILQKKILKNQIKKTIGHGAAAISESGSGLQFPKACLRRCLTSQEDK